jgi:hypothetical protein
MHEMHKIQTRMQKINEQQELNERAKVLEEYNTLKRFEDQDLKNYLSS